MTDLDQMTTSELRELRNRVFKDCGAILVRMTEITHIQETEPVPYPSARYTELAAEHEMLFAVHSEQMGLVSALTTEIGARSDA